MDSGTVKVYMDTSKGAAEMNPSKHAGALRIDQFPEEVRSLLAQVDDEGNGLLEMDELVEIVTLFKKAKDEAEQGVMYVSSFPEKMRDIVRVFDVNDNGRIDQHELQRAAELFQEEREKVRKMAKIIALLVAVCVLLVAAMTGAMFAVVEVTKESKVGGNGIMTVQGTSEIVRVNSAESSVDSNGKMRTANGQKMTSTSASTEIRLTYNTPWEVFSRMEDITVNEPTFKARGVVTGNYKNNDEMVVQTHLFALRLQKGGSKIVTVFEDNMEGNEFFNATSHRRSLLQVDGNVLGTVGDKVVSSSDAGKSSSYVSFLENYECDYQLELGTMIATPDECAALAKADSRCMRDPFIFVHSTIWQPSYSDTKEGGTCHCLDVKSRDYADDNWGCGRAIRYNKLGKEWSMTVYLLDSWDEGEQSVDADTAALGGDAKTPIPNDPNIELIAVDKVCTFTKFLEHVVITEDGSVSNPLPADDRITLDECMDRALADPDCHAHGPTIQFGDYDYPIPEYSIIGGLYKPGSHIPPQLQYACSCSTDCIPDKLQRYGAKHDLETDRWVQPLSDLLERGTCTGAINYNHRRAEDRLNTIFQPFYTRYLPGPFAWPDKGINTYGTQAQEMNYNVYENGFRSCLDPENQLESLAALSKGGRGSSSNNIYTWRGPKPTITPTPPPTAAPTGTPTMAPTSDCVAVNVGPSQESEQTVEVLPGSPTQGASYVCPTTVDKTNWFNGYTYGDHFHVIQNGNELTVRRSDAWLAAWGMDLGFECCLGPSLDTDRPYRLYIGKNEQDADFIELEIPKGYKCPTIINRDNWLGGYTFGDQFVVTQRGTSLKVQRMGVCAGGWGLPLQVECPREAMCTCDTPQEGTAGSNMFTCDSGYIGACGPDQTCYPTEPFALDQKDKGACRTQANEQTEIEGCDVACDVEQDERQGDCPVGFEKDYLHFDLAETSDIETHELEQDKDDIENMKHCAALCSDRDPCHGFEYTATTRLCTLASDIQTKFTRDERITCIVPPLYVTVEVGPKTEQQGGKWCVYKYSGNGNIKSIQCSSLHAELDIGALVCPSTVGVDNSDISITGPNWEPDSPLLQPIWGSPDSPLRHPTSGQLLNEDTFHVIQTGTSISVRRSSIKRNGGARITALTDEQTDRWDHTFKFRCTRPCLSMYVGSMDASGNDSHDAHTGELFIAPDSAYVCPAKVSKYNWLGDDQWPDTFLLTKTGGLRVGNPDTFDNGKHSWPWRWSSEAYDVQRTDTSSGSSGWGMDLKFKCCQKDQYIVNVGKNLDGAEQVVMQIPKGYFCPGEVNQNNWLGGYKNDMLFAVSQNGPELAVRRLTSCDGNGWDMELSFHCERAPGAECQC